MPGRADETKSEGLRKTNSQTVHIFLSFQKTEVFMMKRLKTGKTMNIAALMRLTLVIGVLMWPAVFGSRAFAQSGNSLSFDGTDDYVSLPANTFPLAQGTTEHWIRIPSGTADKILVYASDGGESVVYNGGGASHSILEVHTSV
jgi:hypothetical protein